MLFSAVTLCALDGQPDPKIQRTRALPCVGLAAGRIKCVTWQIWPPERNKEDKLKHLRPILKQRLKQLVFPQTLEFIASQNNFLVTDWEKRHKNIKYLLIQKSDTAQYTLKTEVPAEVPQVTALTS